MHTCLTLLLLLLATQAQSAPMIGTNSVVVVPNGAGTKLFTDNNTYHYLPDIGVSYTNLVATNLGVTDTDVYTIPPGYRGYIRYGVSTTNSTTSIVKLEVKTGGIYYPIVSSTGVTLAVNAAVNSTLFIFEPGDVIAFTTDNAGVNVIGNVVLFPVAIPLKTVRITSVVAGTNTVYTAPAGTVATAPFMFGTLLFPQQLTVQQINNTGMTLTNTAYLDSTYIVAKNISTISSSAAAAPICNIGGIGSGQSLNLVIGTNLAPQMTFISLYEWTP